MNLKKSILRTGAALMTALIVTTSPITSHALSMDFPIFIDLTANSEAVNGIAEDGLVYSFPTYYDYGNESYIDAVSFTTDSTRLFPDNMTARSEHNFYSGTYDYYTEAIEQINIPAGYERRIIFLTSNELCDADWWWSMDAGASENWTETTDMIPDAIAYSTKYKFTLTHNGKTYPECNMYRVSAGEMLSKEFFVLILPQGYDGDLHLTIHGGKLKNGEVVMDEASQLTFYLNGSNAASTQQHRKQLPMSSRCLLTLLNRRHPLTPLNSRHPRPPQSVRETPTLQSPVTIYRKLRKNYMAISAYGEVSMS